MKKKMLVGVIGMSLVLGLVSCGNKDMFDTVYTYDKAIIAMPDGTSTELKIKQWTDYEDGDQIQIISEDGTVYLVDSVNCVLIRE